MSKKQKNRAQKEKIKRREKEQQLSLQKKEKRKKTLKVSLIAFAALCVVLAIAAVIALIIDSSGIKQRNQVFLKTDHFSVNGSMMSYFIYESYNSFKEYYGQYLSTFLKPEEDLKTQNCPYATEEMGTGSKTWFDYMCHDAETSATTLIKACELAALNGISLSEEDLNAINIRAKETDLSSIGHGVNRNDVADCLKLKVLAYKYISTLTDDISVSEEEIDTYYSEHRDAYDVLEYLYVTYSYTSETREAMSKRIETLSASKNRNEFITRLRNYYSSDNAEDIDKALENNVFSVTKSNNQLTEDIVEWLFSAKQYDYRILETKDSNDETKGTYTLYFVSSEPTPDVSATKNVRHILFDSSEYGSAENAEKIARSVYDKFKSNPTVGFFNELVCAYSSDPGSVVNGGLYSNVKEKAMVQSFNDWSFDEARNVGDTDIISSSYGFHIVYFEGEGLPSYKGDIHSVLYKEKYDTKLEGITDSVSVERNKEALNSINGKF